MECPRCGSTGPGEINQCTCGYSSEGQPAKAAMPERFNMFGTTFEGTRIIESPSSIDAEWNIHLSWAIAGIAPLVLLITLVVVGVEVIKALGLAAAFAYISWSSFWGFLAMHRWLMGYREEVEEEGHELLKGANEVLGDKVVGNAYESFGPAAIILPVAIGIIYGSLGGGIWEFLRYLRIIKNPDLTLD